MLASWLAAAAWAGYDVRPVDSPPRPRTALVLSGGGARGAAHIGVLSALEELHVPVDVIVGTSMGSIVGGLYASGRSPETIEAELGAVEWTELFNDRPARKDVSFRRKQLDELSLFQVEFGVTGKGLKLPAGLIAGQKLNLQLRRLTLHTTAVADFDALPIAYRAVAADLATGDPVVLADGDLATAMRASMSIPGVFTPVVVDGRTLVDGGIARNLPIDVARSLGAERIIAVDVSTPAGQISDDASLVGVARQTVGVMADQNVEEQRALLTKGDLLIVPSLESIRAADFGKSLDAVERGRQAARDAGSALERFAVPENEYTVWLEHQRDAAEFPDELVIDEVVVIGRRRVSARLVKGRIRTRPGQPFDLAILEQDLERIYQIGEFEQVDFRLVRVAGLNRLEIRVREKGWGPHYLRFGLSLETAFEGEGRFGVRAVYERTTLNRLGAEWRTIVEFGDTDALFTEFYQPLTYKGPFFVAPSIDFAQSRFPELDENGELRLSDFELSAGRVDFGYQLRNYGEIRVGVEKGFVDRERLPETAEGADEVDIGTARFEARLDQLDNPYFPRSGQLGSTILLASRTELGADDDYDVLSLFYLHAGSFGRNTLLGTAQYAGAVGDELPDYAQLSLGGFLDLSGLEQGELQGSYLGYLSLIYYYELLRLPPLFGGGVYVGASLEAGNVWDRSSAMDLGDLRLAGMLLGGADTLLGPVYLGYGRAEGGASSWYLFLGSPFGRRFR
jgi:NTE family protein